MSTSQKALVVQGGGFRTAFSAGVLDAFIITRYFNFDTYVGVSGGAMALSYFFSGQYRYCVEAMVQLSGDVNFLKFSRIWSEEGYMNIDYIHEVASQIYPFDTEEAKKNTVNKSVEFVATNRKTGAAEYIRPTLANWIDVVIASSTLPFVSRGNKEIGGLDLMDGGWSDPLPVQYAYQKGIKDILVIRTAPKDLKLKISWTDYIGSIYHNDNKPLSECFANSHQKYNDTIDFINNPPSDLKICQISPEKPLKSGTYSYSVDSVISDYRYGLESGLNFVVEERARMLKT